MIIIDKLCYQSNLRYVNATEKFMFAILTLTFCIISRSILMGIAVLIINCILNVRVGGVRMRTYRRLMMLPLTFLVLSTFAIIINFSREPLDAFAIDFGSFYVTGSKAGLWRAVGLIVTAMASVSCLYFLSLNTTMTDIIDVCRKIRVPGLLLELMMLIYRFVFVLFDAAYNITTAQNSRLGNRDFKTKMVSFTGMIQVLFVISMKRSRALYDAMEARCYDGQINVLSENPPVNYKNIAPIILIEAILLTYTVYVKISDHGVIF